MAKAIYRQAWLRLRTLHCCGRAQTLHLHHREAYLLAKGARGRGTKRVCKGENTAAQVCTSPPTPPTGVGWPFLVLRFSPLRYLLPMSCSPVYDTWPTPMAPKITAKNAVKRASNSTLPSSNKIAPTFVGHPRRGSENTKRGGCGRYASIENCHDLGQRV